MKTRFDSRLGFEGLHPHCVHENHKSVCTADHIMLDFVCMNGHLSPKIQHSAHFDSKTENALIQGQLVQGRYSSRHWCYSKHSFVE